MNAHNALHWLYRAARDMADPGASGKIKISKDLQVVELDSDTAESRTLANPTKTGIRAIIRMKTDNGDITMTAANGLNVAGNTTAVFADVGDLLELISVSHTTGYRWEILTNTGSVALS